MDDGDDTQNNTVEEDKTKDETADVSMLTEEELKEIEAMNEAALKNE